MNWPRNLYIMLAWRNIWRNRRRTVITMASVVFAVVLSVLLNSLKEGVLVKMQENAVSFYTGAIQIHQKGYWDDQSLENTFVADEQISETLKEQTRVEHTAKRLESYAMAASEELSKIAVLIGIEPAQEPLITQLDDKLVEGEYLAKDDKMLLLSKGLAEYLKVGVGDTLILLGQGYRAIQVAAKYPIKGLIRLASPELNKRTVYLPLQLAQTLFGAEERLTSMVLKIDNINKASNVAEQIAHSLPNYEVMDWKQLLPELDQMIEGERAENFVFLGVLYLLISFGIFGTILMMLMERQYEFGVLVAIGMRRIKLASIVILENVWISLLGAIIGMLISIPIVYYFYKFPIQVTGSLKDAYENFGFEPIFYFSVEPAIFYNQMLIVLAIAVCLSMYPIFRILRLQPIQAMRGYK